jgi:hypothetical protein
MHRPLLFVAALLAAQPAQAETLRRCGWFVNPTPGNFVLQDADGNWWIQMQGSPPAPGFEDALDRAQPFGTEWVNENTGATVTAAPASTASLGRLVRPRCCRSRG